MKIDTIASQPDRVGRHLVCFSDGTKMRLYRQTVEDFDLYPGLELTQEQMQALRRSNGEMSAKMRAVRIVSASNVSRRDLERRLIHKGEDPVQAQAAAQWMEDLNLIDDRKTAQQIVSRCASGGYGLARAKQALYEKHIPRSLWDEVLAQYPDQTDAIVSFLQTRLKDRDDKAQLHKATQALLRRGHRYSEIRRAMDILSLDTDDFQEE